ncbi:MAG: right-handed parallel beta-helix repeat-containing protein [Phycisphaerales bacterium]|nr:MAG: right-handed parallel beta-helix repeat-containing protein [Phycisphaerales bacterium]
MRRLSAVSSLVPTPGGFVIIDAKHLKTVLLLAAILPCLSALAGSARAQITIYVDQDAIGPQHNGEGWCTAYTDLQEALQYARDNPGEVSEIRVAGGVYKPATPGQRWISFRLVNGVRHYGGYSGCGVIDPNLRSPTRHPTILSGDLNDDDYYEPIECASDSQCEAEYGTGITCDLEGTGRCSSDAFILDNTRQVVFAGSISDPDTVFDGFIIEGGNADGGNPSDRGGGIFIFYGPANLTIANCIIRHNTAVSKAGGMYAYQMYGKMVNCVFDGNWAPYAGALESFNNEIEFINCTFSGNRATKEQSLGVGGLMIAGALDSLVVRNSIFWGNSEPAGMGEHAQFNLYNKDVDASYNSIQGWTGRSPGIGNNGDDPLFIDPLGTDGLAGTVDDDLRLQAGSPCINSGDPAEVVSAGEKDIDGTNRRWGCRVDRGAFESSRLQLPGDFTGNETTDLLDFAYFQGCFDPQVSASDWLDTCLCVFDDNEDGDVDLNDLDPFRSTMTGP